MQYLAIASMALGVLLAAPLDTRDADPKVLQVPLSRQNSTGPRAWRDNHFRYLHGLSKRSDPETSLQFTGVRYFIDYEIGGQKITGILDTGSSDTFPLAKSAGGSNTYDPSSSSTYQYISNNFTESYGDGSENVSGAWAKDTVSVGGASVEGYQIAFLNQSTSLFSDNKAIFGISVENAEAAVPKYPPYVQRLKEQGTISANAFSLFLTNEDATEASLLLGGVDLAKCDGQLYTVPWSTDGFMGGSYYAVDAEFNGQEIQGIWDTGTPQLALPQNIADSIASKYGYSYDSSSGYYTKFGLTNMDNQEGITFSFSGVNITIPAKDLLFEDLGVYSYLALARSIEGDGLTLNIFGDPILRQMNLVFDLDNKQYGISQVKYTTDSNVQAITDSIPGATAAPNS